LPPLTHRASAFDNMRRGFKKLAEILFDNESINSERLIILKA